MISALLFAASAILAAPCMQAEQRCTEFVGPGNQAPKVLVYRSYSLQVRNETVTRALIFLHGINRDADNHFRTALAAAFLAGALADTVIVAPRFAADGRVSGNRNGDCRDNLAPGEANWICETTRADNWRSGGGEISNGKLTSFDFIDDIIRRLARKDIFPNMRKIVVAGHSAGGQFVIRYEMANQMHEAAGVPISYVVSNAAVYPYVDSLRPTSNAWPATISAGAPGFVPSASNAPKPAFVPFPDARNCTGYDHWPYGLKDRVGYSSRLTEEQLTKQLAARPVTYLLGEADILPFGVFDTTCPAMAQGPTRLARGLAFSRYVREHYGGDHTAVVVPFCGHSARCIFTSDVALPVIFPN